MRTIRSVGRALILAVLLTMGATPLGAQAEDACANALEGIAPEGYEIVTDDGSSGSQVVLGTDGDDWLTSGSGDDILCGFGGDDYLDGGSGNDEIYGADGYDVVYGGSGDDTIEPDENDVVDLGSGDPEPDFSVASAPGELRFQTIVTPAYDGQCAFGWQVRGGPPDTFVVMDAFVVAAAEEHIVRRAFIPGHTDDAGEAVAFDYINLNEGEYLVDATLKHPASGEVIATFPPHLTCR